MNRRDSMILLGTLGMSSLVAGCKDRRGRDPAYDVVVVGAGVFGIWTAFYLRKAGRRVAVVEAVAPAHGDASSGGETRVARCGYGAEDLYTEWACRSMAEWRLLSERASLRIFHETGVLWIHQDGAEFFDANAKTLTRHGIPFVRWPAREVRSRFPVLQLADDESGFFEPRGGGLLARRAVQQMAGELEAEGVSFLRGDVKPIRTTDGVHGALLSVTTTDGDLIEAEKFVFACGPWLDRVCPDVMAGRLFVTRQDVAYFAVNKTQIGALPVWADLPFYGLPNLEDSGFKVANDTHGPPMDILELDRRVRQETEAQARDFLAHRFPSLAKSPLTDTRVCPYESSSNGDFVLDGYPGLDNVWIAGCGSGHGFKHGPAVGAHLAGLVSGTEKTIARFSLGSKGTRQQREIQ